MVTRVVSKSMEEAKQRLKRSLEAVDSVAQAQLAALERELLEAKTASLAQEKELQELRQSYAQEKSAREHADLLLREITPRLDEMSSEIINILKNAGADL